MLFVEQLGRKSEQDKIAAEMDAAKRELAEAEADVTGAADAFNRTLDAVGCMADTYREARDIDRRLWNQALFECFRVHPDEEIEGELREEVRVLTDARTPRRLRADCRRRASSGRGWNKSYSAERVGFEPTRRVNPAHAISSRAP